MVDKKTQGDFRWSVSDVDVLRERRSAVLRWKRLCPQFAEKGEREVLHRVKKMGVWRVCSL